MSPFELTLDAEQDLLDIAIYTIKTWGLARADRYESAIRRHFEDLGRGEARTSVPIPHRPELRVSRCLHHYVFSLQVQTVSKPAAPRWEADAHPLGAAHQPDSARRKEAARAIPAGSGFASSAEGDPDPALRRPGRDPSMARWLNGSVARRRGGNRG